MMFFLFFPENIFDISCELPNEDNFALNVKPVLWGKMKKKRFKSVIC